FLFSPLADLAYGAGTWAAFVAAHPKLNPLGVANYLDNDAPKLGFWDANERSWLDHKEQDYMVVNTTTYNINDDLLIKNIYGATHKDVRDQASTVGSPYLLFISENLATGERGNTFEQFVFSDEFQIQGKTWNDSLTYIFGAYYQSSQDEEKYPQSYFDLS